MPIYTFKCNKCGSTLKAMVGAEEEYSSCSDVSLCDGEGEITKALSQVNIRRPVEEKSKKVGELTKEYIEENREVLKDEKQKLADRILD